MLEAHVEYLEQQYWAGYFVASGRKVPRSGGMILARAESRSVLDAVLARDPFAVAGVAEYRVEEFVPGKVAEGFEALLEPSS
ncbi:YciI family protein [Dongshaea marina]|uniref:YciI family protein n=1 Tax=Dongshaea marina TaxID=2047966 RepID=UPI001F2301B0|nr:YciI family protein [Dongshaea marina]